MGRRLRKHSLTSISIVASIVLVLVGVWAGVAAAEDSPTGLKNQGFEGFVSAPPDLDPADWIVNEPEIDQAVVVGTEGPGNFPVYETNGVTVSPLSGERMLRLGVPADKNAHRVRGEVTVSQEFTSDGERPIEVWYRVLTLEHRSDDSFVINVQGGSELLFSYEPEIVLEKGQKFKDFGWQKMTIDDLPETELTISYTLANAKNASHDTWIYIDGNTAPVAGVDASVLFHPNPVYATDDILTASPTGFTDPDDDILTYHYEWFKDGALVFEENSTDPTDPSSTLQLDSVVKGNEIKVIVRAVDDSGAMSDPVEAKLTVSNSPPEAKFTWAPGGPGGEYPHEGDVIGLYGDRSTDPDGDDIVRWKWLVEKDGRIEEYNAINDWKSPVGFIVPHDEGVYGVTLIVEDSSGDESEPLTQAIQVSNVSPRVNALNVEVLQYGKAKLVGRFLDPGWMDDSKTDSKGVNWISPLGTILGQADEDHFGAISSGYVEGTIDSGFTSTAGDSDWRLEVEDEDGGVGRDTFTVRVIEADDRHLEDVEVLKSDWAYLSYIQSRDDVDIFKVQMPDGAPIEPGTEVLVTLRDLPADYDLIVLEGVDVAGTAEGVQTAPFMHSPFSAAPFMHSPFMHSPFMNSPFMNSPFMHSPFMNSPFMHSDYEHSPFMNSPFVNSPFMNSPFMHSPFMHSPFMNSPFMHSPFMNSPFMHSPFMHSPFMHSDLKGDGRDLDGYPLSAMSFTGTADDNTSGIDIAFDELGFDSDAMADLRVLGFSANTETESEVVLATAGYPQTGAVHGKVYVVVKSAYGGYSAEKPYTLQIETSRPLELQPLEQSGKALENSGGSWRQITSETPETLFVTQFDRLESLYEGQGLTVLEALERVAPEVNGKVISIGADEEYTAWDLEPWRVDLANEVARSIRKAIQDELAANYSNSIKYVVLVGNDRIIPFRRLIDQTIIGNEQNYTDQSFLKPPSATLSSIANGYILTDDYYVDQEPISWNGSYLYVPDLVVSRLVETPDQIIGTIDAFTKTGGLLDDEVGLVSGYDFMADGAERVREILGVGTISLIGETWTGEELRNSLINSGTDVGSLNAHFTHFAGLSAAGYRGSLVEEGPPSYDESQLLLSGEIATAGGITPLFEGKLIFSMGCHAGLNVPDQEVDWPADDQIDPALDFPQAMMEQGGVYLGSTGYGYGDTVGIAGTEALIGFFAEELVGGADSVGSALVRAKQEYLGSLSTLTPYDQKSSVQFILYGMPQYHLPSTVSAAQAASTSPASLTAAGVPDGPDYFDLTLSESSMEDVSWSGFVPIPNDGRYVLSLVDEDPTNQYITAGGTSEATADRPIHPAVPVDLPERPDRGPAHGFVYKEGSYTDLPGFEPAISRLTTDWEVNVSEFQVATSEFWPVQPGVLTTIEIPEGYKYKQTFVAVPAQFKPTPDEVPISGTERVWSSLEAEVLRSLGGDWLPPNVHDFYLWMNGGNVTLSVDAEDDSSTGVSRIVVLQMDEAEMRTIGDEEFSEGVPLGAGGRYEVPLTLAGQDPATLSLLIQVVDGFGNVTTITGKGATVRLQSGLRNPSFEEFLRYWTVTQPVVDNAVVIQGADPSPILSDLGITVGPWTGSKMLRLGMPKDKDAHQVKGVTAVSQQFISDGEDILVAYRVITLDSRVDEDVFIVDVKDAQGVPVDGKLYTMSMKLGKKESYGDTKWTKITIADLPEGKTFTITYSLNNTQSASHNTWVYVDQGRLE